MAAVKRRIPGWAKALIVLGVAGIGLPFLMTRGLFSPWKLEGDFMAPGLASGTRFFAARFGSPDIGDVVVIEGRDGEPFVSRVLAGPGDTIELVDGEVIVNGRAVEHRDLGDAEPTERGLACRGEWIGKYHWIALTDPDAPSAAARTTVPEDHVYVLGDNRPSAVDSRTLGPIAEDDIRGVMAWILHPGDFETAVRCRP